MITRSTEKSMEAGRVCRVLCRKRRGAGRERESHGG